MVIGGVSRAEPVRGRRIRGAAGQPSFGVAEAGTTEVETGCAASGVALPSLLAMQEAQSAALQDREARRHGQAVIQELAALQRGMLGESGPDLTRLAGLAERTIDAADPALAGILRAIQLRAGIELARYGSAATP